MSAACSNSVLSVSLLRGLAKVSHLLQNRTAPKLASGKNVDFMHSGRVRIQLNCSNPSYFLRLTKAVESVRLINDAASFSRFYKRERQILEHFRFSDVFLIQTKKAYVSFVTHEDL